MEKKSLNKMKDVQAILNDAALKPKEKTEALSKWLLAHPKQLTGLIAFASAAKDPVKATCIEAMEFATKTDPAIAGKDCLDFVTATLTAKAPRVKWESAKVIGNIAHRFPGELKEPVKNLLVNSEHSGTVVRWSAAFALGEIVKMKTPLNKMLLPAIEAIVVREEKNSIRKIYLAALKKAA